MHYFGAYPSQDFESIYGYLKQKNPMLNIINIHTVEQDNVSELQEDNTGKADFTICVDKDMTKTY